MNKIPCKKCPQCGFYNDFTIEECECGKKLIGIEAQLIDTDLIPPEQFGDIDTSLKVYVQKCSACGALNYTDNPANRVKVCYNCHKTRIAAIDPVEYVDDNCVEDLEADVPGDVVSDNGSSLNARQVKSQIVQDQPPYTMDDEDDEDDESAQWQGILGSIQKTVGVSVGPFPTKAGHPVIQQPSEVKSVQPLNDLDDDDDEDDDDGAEDWSGILGIASKQKDTPSLKQQSTPASVKKDITLTAIRYGRLSFTVEAGTEIYMLGRSANQGHFLSQDGRVGNEHCYLFYRDGAWFVRDNSSKNGTAVNSQDIGLNGERMLSDGDELKLGHHPDSIAFRISIS